MDTISEKTPATATDESEAASRQERVTTVAWLTGIIGVVAIVALDKGASIGAGLAIAGVAAMVTIVSWRILKS